MRLLGRHLLTPLVPLSPVPASVTLSGLVVSVVEPAKGLLVGAYLDSQSY